MLMGQSGGEDGALSKQNLGPHAHVCNKANLLTLCCGEGKGSIYFRVPSKESRAASA